jgi:hypothetical protein
MVWLLVLRFMLEDRLVFGLGFPGLQGLEAAFLSRPMTACRWLQMVA